MKRLLIALLTILALALVFATAACSGDDAGGDSGKVPENIDTSSAESILAAAFEKESAVASGRAAFDLSVAFETDGTAPEGMESLFGQPITATGDVAFSDQNMDMTLALTLAGQPLNVGLKTVDEKVYLSLGDQWYEVPEEMLQQGSGSGEEGTPSFDPSQFQDILDETGVDPKTWLKDLTIVGEEDLNGVETYHIQGTPDLTTFAADLGKLMQNEKFASLMGNATSTAGIDPAEIQEMQEQLPQLFTETKVEFWIAKDTYDVAKLAGQAKIAPPAGEETDGLSAINTSGSVELTEQGGDISVEAPDSPRTFEQLQQDLMADPSLLGPLGMLLMGGLGSDLGGGTLPSTTE